MIGFKCHQWNCRATLKWSAAKLMQLNIVSSSQFFFISSHYYLHLLLNNGYSIFHLHRPRRSQKRPKLTRVKIEDMKSLIYFASEASQDFIVPSVRSKNRLSITIWIFGVHAITNNKTSWNKLATLAIW